MYSKIHYETGEHLARITLSYPQRRNAVDGLMQSEICHALERARDDESVRVVLLAGTGEMFCAGGDLSQILGGAPFEGTADIPPRTFVDLLLLFTQLGKPTVAMVQGGALAAGLGIVLSCDICVAADTAQFGTPEVNVGLWPMMVMAVLLRNASRKAAMRLMLTGERITAEEALRLGLVTEVVAGNELDARTTALARALLAKSPTAMRMGLEAFHAVQGLPLEPALDYLQRQLAALLSSEDAKEGVEAFLNRRPPLFRGR